MSQTVQIKRQRLRVLGKKADFDEITKRFSQLILGNPEKNIKPKSITEAVGELGYSTKSRDTAQRLKKRAIELELLESDPDTGRLIKPKKTYQQNFEEFTKEHPIINDEIVAEWFKDLENRKQGKGVKIRFNMLNFIQKICNTCRVTPRTLISSKESAEEIKSNFMQAFKDQKIVGTINYNRDIQTLDKDVSYAINSICNYYDVFWARNTSKMSRKVVGHGKYPDIRLTNEELQKADQYLKENYGIDSDIYRLFWIGVESCSRDKALYGTQLIYTKHESKKTGKITYFMEAFESKTEHIKDGKWTKFIQKQEVQQSLDALRDRGSRYIWENKEKLPFNKFKQQTRVQLLDLYQYLGKIHNWQELEKTKKEKKLTKTGNYWFDHYTHALRHVGAHYWLSKTHYNYGFVARIGGWHTIDELKKSYGEMPPEVAIDLVDTVNTGDIVA